MQASNFGGTFDQLFLRIFYKIFIEDAPLPLLHHGAKKSKMTKTQVKGSKGVPWFEFLVILDFFTPWYRRRLEAFSVKIA